MPTQPMASSAYLLCNVPCALINVRDISEWYAMPSVCIVRYLIAKVSITQRQIL